MHDLAFIFAGFLVGIVVALTGVGGGSLMTPILIFFFGVKPYLAVGTIKLARARLVDWRVVLHLSAGSIAAALLTLFLLKQLGAASATVQSLITSTLGFTLLLTAAASLYKALRGKAAPVAVRQLGRLAPDDAHPGAGRPLLSFRPAGVCRREIDNFLKPFGTDRSVA